MATFNQDALVDQLGKKQVDAPGFQAPGAPVDPVPAPGPKDYSAMFTAATQGKRPSQQTYAELDAMFDDNDIGFQKNSAGQYRGRVKFGDGQIFDSNLNEGNDAAFLGGGEGTGSFGLLGRGHESQTDIGKGGWSFGGGGGAPMPNLGTTAPIQGTAQAGIAPDLSGYTQASPYLAALMQMLGQ